MAKLQLSMIVSANERSQPVIDGRYQVDGVDLAVTVAHPSEIFWRQLAFQEFDISEMSLSSLLIVTARGDSPWVGLPIFTSRRFFHTGVLVRRDAGIETPADLRGKRVGVPEYQQTAALWSRGVLQHEFGVHPTEMHWFMERTEDRSHGGATGFTPPPGVTLDYIPVEKSIGTMMVSGELDATLLYITDRNLVDRSRVDLDGHPAIRTLFPDPFAEGTRYYQKTGIFPINHGMVVRRSLVETYPWLPLNIFRTFQAAKDGVAARARQLAEPYFQLGLLPPEGRKAMTVDPFPYGVKANRETLETIARYSHEQGLTPRVLSLDEVFAPSTLDV
jgi:4,5-dihydroxyphthalate decarboxylase